MAAVKIGEATLRLGVTPEQVGRVLNNLSKLEIKDSPGKGKGVFAKDDI